MERPSDEYIRGWQAARLYYQLTGGVPPYPKGYHPDMYADAAPAPPAPASPDEEAET